MNNYFKYIISVFSFVLLAGFTQFLFTPVSVDALSPALPGEVNDLRVIGNTLYWTTPDYGSTIEEYYVQFYTGILPSHTADGSMSEMSAQGITFGGCSTFTLKTTACVSSYHTTTTPGGENYLTLSSSFNTSKSYIVRGKDESGHIADYSNVVVPNYSSGYISGTDDLWFEGNYLRWDAPANVHKYRITFYTGAVNSSPYSVTYGGCSYDANYDVDHTPSQYCAGSTTSGDRVTRAVNHREALYADASNTYHVRAYDFNGDKIMDSYGPLADDYTPARITNLSYNESNRRLSWTAPSDVDKYIIRFYTGNRVKSSPDKDDFEGCTYPSGTTCASSSENYNYVGSEYITVDDAWDYRSFMIYYRDSRGQYSEASNSVYVTPEPIVVPEPDPGIPYPFRDTAGHFYEDEILNVYERGIVEGYAGNYYRPDSVLNRAELLKIVLVAQYPTTNYNSYARSGCFYDVYSQDWFAGYVCFAKDRGIVQGYPDGSFGPTNAVTVPEALKMAMETLEPLDYYFDTDDVPGEDWFMPYLYNGSGFLAPTAQGTNWYYNRSSISNDEYRILPWRQIYRGEMAYMITRIIDRLER